jgi:hypothetical protein
MEYLALLKDSFDDRCHPCLPTQTTEHLEGAVSAVEQYIAACETSPPAGGSGQSRHDDSSHVADARKCSGAGGGDLFSVLWSFFLLVEACQISPVLLLANLTARVRQHLLLLRRHLLASVPGGSVHVLAERMTADGGGVHAHGGVKFHEKLDRVNVVLASLSAAHCKMQRGTAKRDRDWRDKSQESEQAGTLRTERASRMLWMLPPDTPPGESESEGSSNATELHQEGGTPAAPWMPNLKDSSQTSPSHLPAASASQRPSHQRLIDQQLRALCVVSGCCCCRSFPVLCLDSSMVS